MANNIQQIDRQKDVKVLVKKENVSVNHKTGEILNTETTTIAKEKARPEFLQLFIENADYFIDLSNMAKNVLFALLSHVDFSNQISLNVDMKKMIAKKTGVCDKSISRGLKELLKKEIFFHIDTLELQEKYNVVGSKWYILNPNLIGRGSFLDLKNLRQSVTYDFDFERGNITKTRETIHTFKDAEDILANPEKYEVEQISEEVQDNHRNTVVSIAEKENDEAICDSKKENDESKILSPEVITLTSELDNVAKTQTIINLSDKEIELALANAAAEDKRLEIKKMELEIKRLELELKIKEEARKEKK